jgi:hypothetical protein
LPLPLPRRRRLLAPFRRLLCRRRRLLRLLVGLWEHVADARGGALLCLLLLLRGRRRLLLALDAAALS